MMLCDSTGVTAACVFSFSPRVKFRSLYGLPSYLNRLIKMERIMSLLNRSSIVSCVSMLCLGLFTAPSCPAGQSAVPFRYVGSSACKPCHEAEYASFIRYAKKSSSYHSIERLKKGLTEEDLKEIIDIELVHIKSRMRERGLELELDEKAKEFIISEGSNLEFGARPLRRALIYDISGV